MGVTYESSVSERCQCVCPWGMKIPSPCRLPTTARSFFICRSWMNCHINSRFAISAKNYRFQNVKPQRWNTYWYQKKEAIMHLVIPEFLPQHGLVLFFGNFRGTSPKTSLFIHPLCICISIN